MANDLTRSRRQILATIIATLVGYVASVVKENSAIQQTHLKTSVKNRQKSIKSSVFGVIRASAVGDMKCVLLIVWLS